MNGSVPGVVLLRVGDPQTFPERTDHPLSFLQLLGLFRSVTSTAPIQVSRPRLYCRSNRDVTAPARASAERSRLGRLSRSKPRFRSRNRTIPGRRPPPVAATRAPLRPRRPRRSMFPRTSIELQLPAHSSRELQFARTTDRGDRHVTRVARADALPQKHRFVRSTRIQGAIAALASARTKVRGSLRCCINKTPP